MPVARKSVNQGAGNPARVSKELRDRAARHVQALESARRRAGLKGSRFIAREEPGEVRVPSAQIICAELDALSRMERPKGGAPDRAAILSTYGRYCAGLSASVKSWAEGQGARSASRADEGELFRFAADVFHKDFGASFKESALLTDALSGGALGFNCYSSSVILADALCRAGKPVGVILAEGHVMLSGSSFAFETTAEGEGAAIPKGILGEDPFYSGWRESGVDSLLGVSLLWCGNRLLEAGREKEALIEFSGAARLGLRADAFCAIGAVHSGRGRFREALESYNRAAQDAPRDYRVWNNIGLAFAGLGKREDALSAFSACLSLNGGCMEAWLNKAEILRGMPGRREEWLECVQNARSASESARASPTRISRPWERDRNSY
jgi:tetratricopeptide (TPR) repeat protein